MLVYQDYGLYGDYYGGRQERKDRRHKRKCRRTRKKYRKFMAKKKRKKARKQLKKARQLECQWAAVLRRKRRRDRARRQRRPHTITPKAAEDELSEEEEALDAQMASLEQQLAAGPPAPAPARGFNPLWIVAGLGAAAGLFFLLKKKPGAAPRGGANGR